MKSIKLNFVYNILLNVSSVIFPLITAPYVARVLAPDGVGLYSFASTYAGYFALVALLGIPTYGLREVAKMRDDKEGLTKLISELLSIAVITTFAVTIVYLITIAVIGILTENYILYLLAGFAIYLAPFKINWVYQGLEEFGFITLRTIVIRILSIICLFLFVHEKSDLIIYIIISVLGDVVAYIWNYFKMWRSGIHPRLTLKGLKQHLKPLWLLFASSIAISVYTVLDTLMIGFIKDYTEVGYYNNASHLAKMGLMVITSLSSVVIPRFSYYIRNEEYEMANSLVHKSCSFVIFLSVPMAIGLICIAPAFVPWFFGDQFYGSVLPLQIMAFLLVAIGLSNITGVQVLLGMRLDKLYLSSILVGTGTNFLLNCILIPFIGANGASIASVCAEFAITGVMLYFIYTRTVIRMNIWKDVIKAFMGALLFIPLLLIVPKEMPTLAYMSIYVLACAIVYYVSQYILHNEMLVVFKDAVVSVIHIKQNK